jgi:hypothetical protein
MFLEVQPKPVQAKTRLMQLVTSTTKQTSSKVQQELMAGAGAVQQVPWSGHHSEGSRTGPGGPRALCTARQGRRSHPNTAAQCMARHQHKFTNDSQPAAFHHRTGLRGGCAAHGLATCAFDSLYHQNLDVVPMRATVWHQRLAHLQTWHGCCTFPVSRPGPAHSAGGCSAAGGQCAGVPS